MKRQRYPTDLTDAQWAALEPEIPAPRPGGRPRKTDMREVTDAIFYLTHEGCTWRALPHDFPRWKTVYNYFDAWKRDGTWDRILDILRPRLRKAAGRPISPRVACIDSQSVKTAGGGQEVGTDGGKKVRGRKRHIVVDTLGLLMEVVVVGREPGERRLVPLKSRWVVERTFAWLGRYRRLSKDYEHTPSSSEAVVQIAAIHHYLRRLHPVAVPDSQRFRFEGHRPKQVA